MTHQGGEEFLRAAMMCLLRDTNGDIGYKYMFAPDRAYARICRQLIREGQEKGEFRDDLSADELFMLINIFSNGIDQQCYLQGKEVDVLENYGEYLTEFVRYILLQNSNK